MMCNDYFFWLLSVSNEMAPLYMFVRLESDAYMVRLGNDHLSKVDTHKSGFRFRVCIYVFMRFLLPPLSECKQCIR